MSYWARLGNRFWKRKSYLAEQVTASAYRSVFSGNGTNWEAQAVLTDLGAYTRFYLVSSSDVSASERAYADGKRDVYSRILNYLRLTDEEVKALEEAVFVETRAAAVEGNL